MSAIERIGSDVRALLVERYEQWQRTVPWYRRAPEPVEVVPMTLALERLVRELRAELASANDRAEDLREELGRERLEREDERHDARAELARVSALLDAANNLTRSALRELAHAARAKASVVREAKRLAAELASAYAQRDRQRDKADTASRLYLDKQAEFARDLWRIMRYSLESGLACPTDDEEANGRTLDVFVREIARGYRKARLMLALLEGERATWRSEALLYREGVVWNVECLGCAGLLTKLCAAEEKLESSASEIAWLRKVEAGARRLVATLPTCDDLGDGPDAPVCERPATRARGPGGRRYCDAHAPEGCPDYPRAGAVRALVELFDEGTPSAGPEPELPTGDPPP